MPIKAFSTCLSGDISKVSKNRYFTPMGAKAAWGELFNQYVGTYGLPDAYREYLTKMVKAIDFYDQAFNGKKWQIVRARVMEAEAESLIGVEGERIETTCARISKYMGFPVRPNECSVTDFYNYIAIMTTK